jgi:hypothetical protein
MSVLNFRWSIDLALTVASYGWVQLAPWRWDPEAGRLARIERIGDLCGTVGVVQRTSCAVVITSEGSGAADEPRFWLGSAAGFPPIGSRRRQLPRCRMLRR